MFYESTLRNMLAHRQMGVNWWNRPLSDLRQRIIDYNRKIGETERAEIRATVMRNNFEKQTEKIQNKMTVIK